MTVSSTSLRRSFFPGSAEPPDEFAYDWLVFTSADVLVYFIDVLGAPTLLVEGTHYDVAINPDQNAAPGGVVTITDTAYLPVTPAALLILGDIQETQLVGLPNTGPWNPRVVEKALDKLTAIVQEHTETLSRVATFPVHEQITMPQSYGDLVSRSNKSLGFNADGDLVAGGDFVSTGIPVSGFMQTVLDDGSAAAALGTLGFTAFALTMRDDADASASLSTLGFSTFFKTLVDDATAGDVLTSLGFSAFAKTLVDDTSAGAYMTTLGLTPFGQGLVQLADAAALIAFLGLGTMGFQNASAVAITGGSITGITDLAVADGGTGASTAADARANLGSGAAGDAVFVAATAAVARAAIGAVNIAGDTFTGDVSLADNLLVRPTFKDYAYEQNAAASAGGVLTLDLTTGNAFSAVLAENITAFVLSNAPATGFFGEVYLALQQAAIGGPFTATYGAAFKFPGGTDHTMSAGANAIDVLHFKTLDSGVTWLVDFQKGYA